MCFRTSSEGNSKKMHICVFPMLLTSLTCKYTCMLVRETVTDCIQITNSSYMGGAKVTKCTLPEYFKLIIATVTTI